MAWLEERHINFLNELSNIGVQIYESHVDLRLFSWISDDSAIFSFYNYGNKPREVSFFTNDQSFINILKDIGEEMIYNITAR
jgi:hypothetical protein